MRRDPNDDYRLTQAKQNEVVRTYLDNEDWSVRDTAHYCSVSYIAARNAIIRAGIIIRMGPGGSKDARNAALLADSVTMSHADLARKYQITRQRVGQIVKAFNGEKTQTRRRKRYT